MSTILNIKTREDSPIRNLRLDQSITDQEYFAVPAASAHGTYKMLTNPLAWNRPDEEPTDAMKFGSALHCAVLQPDKFLNNYVPAPEVNLRTKAGKEEYEQFLASHADKTVLKSEDNAQIVEMRSRVNASSRASEILGTQNLATFHETAAFWDYIDKSGNAIPCKAKYDALMLDYVANRFAIGDLKTAKSASPEEFAKSCVNFGYGWQAAWYLLPLLAAFARGSFRAVAIEKSAPYDLGIYDLADFAATETANVISLLENYELLRGNAEMKTEYEANEHDDVLAIPAWWKGTRIPSIC